MRVAELKALVRERELRGYSRLRKAELIVVLRNKLQPPRTPATRNQASNHSVNQTTKAYQTPTSTSGTLKASTTDPKGPAS